MTALDPSKARWRKSTRSGTNGNCVEVATNLLDTARVVLVRDSKHPDDAFLAFTKAEWEAFVGGVQDGEFNL
jgi:hypothetical protein